MWVGDVLLASSARCHLERNGYDWPFEQVRPLLAAHYVIGNAEGPITDKTEKYFSDQRWSYNARPESVSALANAGFNALGLANNHALDRGPDGLRDTIGHLSTAGIESFGAGEDINAAAAPLRITTPYGQIAVIAFGQHWRHGLSATPCSPGTIPFSGAAAHDAYTDARANGARWVIAYCHWGQNYAPVTEQQREQATHLARAGYDLVIGTGSHTPQPVEVINATPILYSLGNFVFGTKGRFNDRAPGQGQGLVARTRFTDRGLDPPTLTCIDTDNRTIRYQPRPSTRATARATLERLGPAITISRAHQSQPNLRWPRRILSRGTYQGTIGA